MGAVTAIMYGDRDPSIAGMVLDSAFASLKELIEELVKERVNLPNFVLNQATKLVKSTIMKKAKFNLDEIEPKNYAVRCFIPALFCHGKEDSFVNQHHCKDLSDVYAGDKNVIYVEGNHNSARPRYFKDSASIFFYNTLQLDRIKEISDDYNGFKHVIMENEENKNNNNEINNFNENNNINEFNDINENVNEDLMFQKILELSLKEYEQKKSNENINNDNQISNNKNNNIYNNDKSNDNIININSKEDKRENIIESNNEIINNIINKGDIIDQSDCYPNDSKIENQIIDTKNQENDKISQHSKKGLFEDLNPIPLQNHIRNGDLNFNDS
jgi:hypothetical protein